MNFRKTEYLVNVRGNADRVLGNVKFLGPPVWAVRLYVIQSASQFLITTRILQYIYTRESLSGYAYVLSRIVNDEQTRCMEELHERFEARYRQPRRNGKPWMPKNLRERSALDGRGNIIGWGQTTN